MNGFEDRLDGIGGDTDTARDFRESDSPQQIQKDGVIEGLGHMERSEASKVSYRTKYDTPCRVACVCGR